MRPESRKLLFDMDKAISALREFTQGKSVEVYRDDLLLQSAVERQFQIPGEALFQLKRIDPDTAGRVNHHRDIINFRHILVHAYDRISNEIVWGTIERDLDQLANDIQNLLNSPGAARE